MNNGYTNRTQLTSSLYNILNKNDNIHRNEASKSQLEGQLYYTNMLNCFINDHLSYILAAIKSFSSIIAHLAILVDVGFREFLVSEPLNYPT